MYDSNSARISYYRNRNEQQYESYDDDFKWFTKEAKAGGNKGEKRKIGKKKRKVSSFLYTSDSRYIIMGL